MKKTLAILSAVIGGIFVATAPVGAFEPFYERPPILYNDTEADTKLTRLFAAGGKEKSFSSGTDREILQEMLERLDVPLESQVLVFSKTSAQNSRIAPLTPRAIYFSDDVYIGWVQGGEIEVVSFDKRLGMVFHLVKLSEQTPGNPPPLVRERSCLSCHAGSSNQNFPGLMVRSVYPSDTGLPFFEAGTFHTRHSSPVEERWGGWYVTGSVEGLTHLGNAIGSVANRSAGVTLERLAEAPVAKLDEWFDARPYPHGGESDVVALMTLEHQVGVHNVLVEANLTTQATLHRHVEMQKAFGEPLDAPLSETNERILDRLAHKVLREMLYVEEVELPGSVEGSPSFQAAFAGNRRKSEDGRSLKDYRLYNRLMKYRCSHLIYSEAFTHLPGEIRVRILDKLHGILTEPEKWPDFAHLSDSERGHIREILRGTLTDLPPSWKQ